MSDAVLGMKRNEDALATMQREAAEHGATLDNDGKGNLPSDLVLRVFQRDRYQCKKHGGRDALSVHHRGGGDMSSPTMSKLGHETSLRGLVCICAPCHDKLHEDAKAKGTDSSQVTPVGDQ